MSLKDFETGAGRVEKSLNKLADGFSGRKIIQDANLMAEAIHRIGGASQLTEAEQRRVNAVLTEAIAKYKALGVEAPTHMRVLAEATKQVADNTSKIEAPANTAGNSFKQLFGAFTLANVASNAIGKITSEVQRFVANGQQLPAIQQGFERLNIGVKQSSDGMLQSLRTATKGMVSDFELMKGSNKALLLGLPVTEESMGELAAAATSLGRAMGMDATKSLDDLITALGRSSPMILDNLGLSVKLGEANEAYAAKLGKTVEAMTDAEKKMAFYEAAMEAARKKTAELGDQTKTLGEILTTMWTSVENRVTRAVGEVNVGLGRMLSSTDKFEQAMRSGGGANPVLTGFAISAASAQEKFDQLDKTLKQSVLAKPPKGWGEIPALPVTLKSLEEMDSVEKKLTQTNKEFTKALEERNQKLDDAARKGVAAFKASEDALRQVDAMFQRLKSDAIKDSFLGEKGRAMLHDNVEETRQWIVLWTKGIPVVNDVGKALEGIGEKVDVAAPKLRSWLDDMRDGAFAVADAFYAAGRSLGGFAGEAFRVLGGLSEHFGTLVERSKEFRSFANKGWQESVSYVADWFSAVYSYYTTAISLIEKFQDELTATEKNTTLAARGGLSQLRADAILAGRSLQELPHTATEFRLEIARLDRDIEASRERMERYNLTWHDFNDAIQQSQIDQFTRTLITDFRALTLQMGSSEKATHAMRGGLSQLVIDAVKTGQKIPIALKPILEQLIRMGDLSEDAAAALLGIQRESVPAFEDIKQAAERYGIELDKLGPKINQLRINEAAEAIAKDFKFLIDAGADFNTVLVGMADEVQNLVTDALKAGLTLPESMRPMIEAMIRAGLLTDEFGDKLTDTSRLEFAKPLSERFDDLLEKLDELIDALSDVGTTAEREFGRARRAAEDYGKAVPRGSIPVGPPGSNNGGGTATPRPDGDTTAPPSQPRPDPNVPRDGSSDNPPPDAGTIGALAQSILREMDGFRGGTRGQYLDFGSGRPVILHGRERIVPEGEVLERVDEPQPIIHNHYTIERVYGTVDPAFVEALAETIGTGGPIRTKWKAATR